ncbi:MAG: T9SS type A sorting domain-containing protein [Lewinellaceae bacterium]|nr:T9SS type A sorting domain-containing protein [Lewinellaceae bacterium]
MKTKLPLLLCLLSGWLGIAVGQDFHQRLDLSNSGICRDLVRMPDGSVILVGELTGSLIPRGWVARLDADGKLIWSQTVDNLTNSSRFRTVIADTDSSVMIGGTIFVDNLQGKDMLVCRMNLKGKVQWTRTLDVDFEDELWDICPSNKGVLLTGHTQDNNADYDLVVGFLDQQGVGGIVRQIGAAGLEYPKAIIQASPSEIYVSGTTTSYTSPGNPPSAFLLKLNGQASLEWVRLIGNAAQQSVESMGVNDNGQVLVALHDADGIGQNAICTFDASGDLVWAKSYNTSYLRAMSVSPGGRIHLADDGVVFSIDDTGSVQDGYWIPTTGNFILSSLQASSKGHFITAGWVIDGQDYPAVHNVNDPTQNLCGLGPANIFSTDYVPNIIPQLINEIDAGTFSSYDLSFIDQVASEVIDCQVTSVDVSDPSQVVGSVSPNPASDQVVIQWPSCPGGWVTWYDTQGKILDRLPIQEGQNQVDYPLNNWPAGMYLMEFTSPRGRWMEKVIRMD